MRPTAVATLPWKAYICAIIQGLWGSIHRGSYWGTIWQRWVLMQCFYSALSLRWVPWEQNQAADDLTNLNFSKFDEKHRIPLEPAKLNLLVLGKLNQAAGELYKDLLKEKENKLSSGSIHKSATPKRKVTERLKWKTRGNLQSSARSCFLDWLRRGRSIADLLSRYHIHFESFCRTTAWGLWPMFLLLKTGRLNGVGRALAQ